MVAVLRKEPGGHPHRWRATEPHLALGRHGRVAIDSGACNDPKEYQSDNATER